MATRILLDTHVWLWMNGEPERLSSTARDLLSDADNVLFLSAASVWEIAIKVASRKLVLPEPPERYITDRLFKNQVTSSKTIAPQGSTAEDTDIEDPDNEDNEGSDNQDGDNQDGDNQDGDTQDAS